MDKVEESALLRQIIIERIKKDEFADSQAKLADAIDKNQSQISEMLSPHYQIKNKAWDHIQEKLGRRLIATDEDRKMLRAKADALKNQSHHGKQLDNYLKQRGIKDVEAAKILGIAPPRLTRLKSTQQFRHETLIKTLEQLPFLTNENPNISNGLTKLPYLVESKKIEDLSHCPQYDYTATGDHNLTNAIVFKVETDIMEPTIRKDSELLAIHVEAKEYKYHLGLTIIRYANRVAIGEVKSNDIFDKGYITLYRGDDTLKVASEDIQNIWQIVLGINVKY